MSSLLRFAKVACTKKVVTKAVSISLVVGSLLNLINQGEHLISLNFDQLNIAKLLFTYLVPYAVTTYTAVSLHLEFNIGQKAIMEADLECKVCRHRAHVNEQTLIPECPKCGLQTRWRVK